MSIFFSISYNLIVIFFKNSVTHLAYFRLNDNKWRTILDKHFINDTQTQRDHQIAINDCSFIKFNAKQKTKKLYLIIILLKKMVLKHDILSLI